MAVYTKIGDKGSTGTFSGKRVSKSSKLIEAIGAIDELNSYLGVVGGLTQVQQNLFTINAILSGAKLKFSNDAVAVLEEEIDDIEGKLPVQKNFLIYSGNDRSRKLYFARALCRRAERRLVQLGAKSVLLVYINRLSDYLFMKARESNFKKGAKETYWKPSK